MYTVNSFLLQLDLPFSVVFYRWLLGQESTLSLPDLAHVCPEVHHTLCRLQGVQRLKDQIDRDSNLTANQRKKWAEKLDLDGCPIQDLGLDFTLPGHAGIELRKGGRDISLCVHNIDQYTKVRVLQHFYAFIALIIVNLGV